MQEIDRRGHWSPGVIARGAAAVAGVAVATKALGFLEKVALAYYFGTDARVDAYFVATSVPILLFLWIRELIEPPFLPLFVQKLEDGREAQGWRLFSLVGLALALLAGACALAARFASEPLVASLAPGFDGESMAMTGRLLRLLAPAALFLSLSSITYITLNAYGRFLLPASGDLALKAAPLLCCILFVSQLGIQALALGYLVGAIARLGIHALGLRGKLGMLALPTAEDRADLVRFGWLVLPLVLGSGFAQISELADNHFSSLIGAGGVAVKSYARKIRDVPLEIVGYSLSVVLFPYFAHRAAALGGEWLRVLARCLRGLALFFSALGVVLFVLREPLVSLILERGAFDREAREATAGVLAMYSLGMSAFALEGVLVLLFFALKDTLTPVTVGILGVLLHIALCALLIGPLGVGGVALALTVSKTVKLIALGVLLHRRERCVVWGSVLRSALRIAAAAGVSGLAMELFLSAWSPDLAATGFLPKAALVGGVGALGALAFLATVLSAGGEERALLLLLAQRVFRPRERPGS